MTIHEHEASTAPIKMHSQARRAVALAALLSAACSAGGGGGAVASLGAGGSEDGMSVGGDTSVFHVVGPEGGPFDGGRRTYELINTSLRTITWEVEATQPWLAFDQDAGLLGPGVSTLVTTTLVHNVAEGLPRGEYPADIIFRNATSDSSEIYLAFLLSVVPNPDGSTLWVSPEEDQQISGEAGQPLDPQAVTYTLINQGTKPLDWELAVDSVWMLPPDRWAGSLDPGTSTEVVIGLDGAATESFPADTYMGTASFGITSSPPGSVLTRGIELNLSSSQNDGRIEEGLLALYDFEQPGAVVRDVSGVEPKHDLAIEDAANVQWLPGVLRIAQGTRLLSPGPATKIVDACKASHAITVEAWITPANLTQDGPARIATISDGASARDVTLGQGLWGGQPSDTFNVRLRSTATDNDGMPLVSTPPGAAKKSLQHVVYTRDSAGTARLYVDGNLAIQGNVGGDLSNWDESHRLALANELGAWRPWLGDMHLVAIYEQALDGDEVLQNFEAGSGDAEAGHLVVDPVAAFTITGVEGDSFSDSSKVYTLTNPGPDAVEWTAVVSEPWIWVDGAGGSLASGGEATSEVNLDLSQALTFSPGYYEASVDFTNTTNGLGSTSRKVVLIVKSEGDNGDGEKPGPDNTGPTNPELLVPSGSITVTQDGAVIENVRVSGTIYVKANNVLIRNFIVDGNGAAYGIRCDYNKQGIRIEDGELTDCSSAGIYGSGFSARRLDIHEMGADGLKCRGDNLIEGCWIHNLGLNPGAHADGNQTRSGSNITLRGNFFDMPTGQPGGYKSNACSINQAEIGDINNLVMEGNWLNGGNYTVYFTAKPEKGNQMTNCKLIYNRFGRDYKFGVLLTTGNVFNLEITGNVWDDTGEDMDINN
jgi:Concanavalin A-like lectin/glucanases superfamily